MNWLVDDTWIVIVGALCAVACALPGCFLVLRQMSLMGDAISHAVLPGLALAFLISGSRSSLTMFVGAAIVGVLTAVFVQAISTWGRVDRGASMGIVFTTLFALGLLLIVQAADHVDLDPICVLYGAIEWTYADTFWRLDLGNSVLAVPRAAVVLGAVLLLNLGIILALFKELRLSSFDPALATSMGIHAGFMHYLLMTMVAVTTVAAFEVVGSIIVIAMLIVPAATASLLTDRLSRMLWISAGVGIVSAALGHVLALLVPEWINTLVRQFEPAWTGFAGTSTSGMIAVVTGLVFLAAWALAPGKGLLTRLHRKRVAGLPTTVEPAAPA
ncbi:MAG: metal ABC transporter permease [Opitutales bacterium]